MKILITGATGFIGKYLTKSLIKNNKIRCFVRRKSKEKDIAFLENLGAEIFYGDIFDKQNLIKSMKGIDAVFHLAGGGNVATTFKKGYNKLKKLNVESTDIVLNAAIKSKVKKFIHFSSISAMGIIVEKKLDETSKCLPQTPHEVCKFKTEQIMEKHKDKILITIIRPGIVYGPYAINSEILQIGNLMKKHFFIIPGNGKNITPWVYVEDVIDATMLAFKKNKKSGEKFIIVSDPEPTFNQLIDEISKELKIKVFVVHIPAFLFRFTGHVLEKLGDIFRFEPLINSVRAKSMTSNRIYNITKIKKLGYKQKFKLNQGIKNTIQWYKKNGYL